MSLMESALTAKSSAKLPHDTLVQDQPPTFTAFAALGEGDNNDAEMYALDMALGFALREARRSTGTPEPHLFFTDSLGALCFILHGWKFQGDKAVAYRARDRFNRLSALCPARIYWVRGHSGIPGNEEADAQADLGSSLSRDSPYLGFPSSKALYPR